MLGSWYDELARIFSRVEDVGVWPDGLLNAYIAMIPKTDGDAISLGQGPLSVLPVVYRIWASARVGQLEDWFRSWVLDSVFSAGCGRGSVEAWYATALDIEEVLTGAADSDVHLFVADVIKSFDTVDGDFGYCFEQSWATCIVPPFLFRVSCSCSVAVSACFWPWVALDS